MTATAPKSAGWDFGAIQAAMCRRAKLRADWLHSLPEGDPMRVLATLQNTAACFMSRQTDHDRRQMKQAIEAAKQIEDAAFTEWLSARPKGDA